MSELKILAKFDDKAKVWYIAESDIPGLHVESETVEGLIEVIADVAVELIRANMPGYDFDISDVPLRVMAESLVHARLSNAA